VENDLQLRGSYQSPPPCTLHVYVYMYMYPLFLQVIFRKSDLYLVALLWKMICNLGDPISLRHSVRSMCMQWLMEWLRLVGSSKLQVSFAEYSLFHRALLQKRPIILRSLRSMCTYICTYLYLFLERCAHCICTTS